MAGGPLPSLSADTVKRCHQLGNELSGFAQDPPQSQKVRLQRSDQGQCRCPCLAGLQRWQVTALAIGARWEPAVGRREWVGRFPETFPGLMKRRQGHSVLWLWAPQAPWRQSPCRRLCPRGPTRRKLAQGTPGTPDRGGIPHQVGTVLGLAVVISSSFCSSVPCCSKHPE